MKYSDISKVCTVTYSIVVVGMHSSRDTFLNRSNANDRANTRSHVGCRLGMLMQ